MSISSEFQRHLSEPTCAHGLIDNLKDKKWASRHTCTERDY